MKTKYKLTILFITLVIVLLILFSINVFNKDKESYESIDTKEFKLKPGDIIITKGPVLFGFFGHSSIAIDEDTVLQIEGPGDQPITESFESYQRRFGTGKDDWIKVYRSVKPDADQKAANWVKRNYENSDSRYLVTLNLKSQKFTYCTKIIYQAYKYGVDKNAVSDHGLYIISPYALKDNFTHDYRLKLVKNIKN
ncbi:lipoprotein N-acylation protein LnsA [Staphylococcus capitis]|uniref:lipoprotein N-acylation protein LnsA n=1 Tax=Staphylococcus capitis TaxID=29388 RepID=UPI0032199DA0